MRLLLGRLLQFFLPHSVRAANNFLRRNSKAFARPVSQQSGGLNLPSAPSVAAVCLSRGRRTPVWNLPNKEEIFYDSKALGSYQGVLQEAIHR